jgi:hypothetical protein
MRSTFSSTLWARTGVEWGEDVTGLSICNFTWRRLDRRTGGRPCEGHFASIQLLRYTVMQLFSDAAAIYLTMLLPFL